MIFAVVNQKGGVGKTTTAFNLSAALALSGKKVLLADLDAQGNATRLAGHDEPETSIFDVLTDNAPLYPTLLETSIKGLMLAPANRSMAALDVALHNEIGREFLLRDALESVAKDFDYVVIDNGPALGMAPVMSLCAAQLAIVPLQCEPMALQGLAQIQETIGKIKRARLNSALEMRILLTMVEESKPHSRNIRDRVREAFGDTVFQTEIRRYTSLASGALKGGSILTNSPKSPAAAAFRSLVGELVVKKKSR
jgi:chromosome partitioning protein